MENGWTGAQISVVRALLAVDVACRLVALGSGIWAVFGVVAALLFALGVRLHLTGPALFACSTLLAAGTGAFDAGLSVAALLALLISAAPGAPYGSWDRRLAADPGTDWRLPAHVTLAAWILLALSYARHGGALLGTGPGATLLGLAFLAFAPLAFSAAARPWLFAVGLGVQLLLPLLGEGALSPALAIPHLLLFDPAWIPSRGSAGKPSMVFYDGGCALCHGTVRFLIAEDAEGARFRYAPLDGDAFRDALARASLTEIPDSVALLGADGALRVRSDAMLRVGQELGGFWRLLADALRFVPGGIRDRVYDGVAATRYRVFGTQEDACPLIAADIRRRFDF